MKDGDKIGNNSDLWSHLADKKKKPNGKKKELNFTTEIWQKLNSINEQTNKIKKFLKAEGQNKWKNSLVVMRDWQSAKVREKGKNKVLYLI